MKNRRSSKKKGGKKKKASSSMNHQCDTNGTKTPSPPTANATAPPPATTTKKPSQCLHGSPEGYADDVGQDKLDAFLADMFSMKGVLIVAMQKLRLIHPLIEHPDTAQFLYSLSSSFWMPMIQDRTFTTKERHDKADLAFQAAIFCDKCFKKRPQSVAEALDESARVQWCFVKHCGSVLDSITYLDKKIPCDCLSRFKQTLIEDGSETRCCEVCLKTVAKTLWCSKCLMREYCSKECQVADWPRHKRVCRLLCGKVTSHAFVLEERKVMPGEPCQCEICTLGVSSAPASSDA
ncbi:expressed unknown protein [Seminavis robusta]|uniref:MYND-type domain-containing protein n=1 Tax=Seminavis robusta TaxID=568900 RepID=A0A9N8DR62_9STRA|nr:expressed unknown protein [Seminavis robusta]|eukprot:Sro296_g110800.1 n/a (292) ;mRNA; r:76164-77039